MSELDITDTTRTADEAATVRAVDVVARRMSCSALHLWIAERGWETIPDVGEHDYGTIVERMAALLPEDATVGEFNEAYEYLAKRAEDERVDE